MAGSGMNPIIMYATIGFLVGVVLEVLIGLVTLLVATFVRIKTVIRNLLLSMFNKKSEGLIMNNSGYYEGDNCCQESTTRESQSTLNAKKAYNYKVLIGVLVVCMLAAVIAQVVTGDFMLAAAVAILSMAPVLVFTCVSYLVSVTGKSETTMRSPHHGRAAAAPAWQAGPGYPVQHANSQHHQNAYAARYHSYSAPSAPPQDYTQNASYFPTTFHQHTTDPHYSQHTSPTAFLQSHLPPSYDSIQGYASGASTIQNLGSLHPTLPASNMAGTHVSEATVHYHSSGACEHFR